MSSFINKFFGFVKNVLTGSKKDNRKDTAEESGIIHAHETEQKVINEAESQVQEQDTQEHEVIYEADVSEQEIIQEEDTQEQEVIHEAEVQEPEIIQEQPVPEHEVIPEAESPVQELIPESESLLYEPEPEQQEQEVIPEAEAPLQEQEVQEQELTHESEQEAQEQEEIQEAEQELTREYDYEQNAQKIRNIIIQHYSYSGFAINDTAGYSLFRTYAKNYDIELPESDSELRRLIIHSGTLIDGIVYVFSHDDVQRMLLEVQRLINEGVNVIYFRELEIFIEDSNLYSELSNRRAVCEILRDNYDSFIFTELYMENSSGHKAFRSYMEGLRYVLSKYFPDGFTHDYNLLREYAARENIMLSGSDKALKRETEALKEQL